MMATTKSDTTVDLSELDTGHLASQALTLFSRRYGRLYDTSIASSTLHQNRGYLAYEDHLAQVKLLYPTMTEAQVEQLSLQMWKWFTGGCTPKEVYSVNRQQAIDLCVKGYHSKDEAHVAKLRQVIQCLGSHFFDMMDTNHNGYMSLEEYAAVIEHHGASAEIQGDFVGVFESMDLNGDGRVSREEYLQVFEGFVFHVDEDRYNHVAGILDN